MSATKPKTENTGIILLAAGASSRLGQPKQLLSYEGQTLLQRSVEIALASDGHPIVVVLGANAGAIKKEIEVADVHVVINDDWQEGMASSIRRGIETFTQNNPGAEGIILMVCDQPFVTASLLNELIAAHQKTGKPIVPCSYDNTFGPPVFFHKTLFEELLRLKGDVGARGIVRQHTDDVEVIPFPDGRYDVDTEADYESISGRGKQ